MRTVFSNHELVHIYARQGQEEGRNAKTSMFFEGTKFYSYNRAFCISNLLDLNTVLFNSRSYSVTTSQHQSSVRYALNHINNSYSVPYPDLPDNPDNLSWCIDEFNMYVKKHIRARTNSYLSELFNLKETLYFLIHEFDFSEISLERYQLEFDKMIETLNSLEKDPSELIKKIKEEDKKRREAEKQKQFEIMAEKAKEIEDWKEGKIDSLPWNIATPYLRLSADKTMVETSKGVCVRVQNALQLWWMIENNRDIKGHNIDGYTVISINGTLKIGCHDIQINEVKRFGAILTALNKEKDLVSCKS